MDAQTAINNAFSSVKNRDRALAKLVENRAFAKKCPSTHSFLQNLQSQMLRRGHLTPDQSAAVGRTMEKYIPIAMELRSAGVAELNEMNRHAENDGAG